MMSRAHCGIGRTARKWAGSAISTDFVSEAAASLKEFRFPAFEFAGVFVNKWPDIGMAQPTGGKWKA
jgi:hypothetical protein